jgi:hypothetical protein
MCECLLGNLGSVAAQTLTGAHPPHLNFAIYDMPVIGQVRATSVSIRVSKLFSKFGFSEIILDSGPKSPTYRRHPVPVEGALAIVIDVGAGCDGRCGLSGRVRLRAR